MSVIYKILTCITVMSSVWGKMQNLCFQNLHPCAIQPAMTGRLSHPNQRNITNADVSLRFIYRAVAMNTKLLNKGQILN